MQIFPCPFCGPRDESEFHYVSEPKARPEPSGSVSDAEWANYLWFNANPKGEAREIWLHLTCMEMFAMTRRPPPSSAARRWRDPRIEQLSFAH
jgi:sarcosine oxidase subunit delta